MEGAKQPELSEPIPVPQDQFGEHPCPCCDPAFHRLRQASLLAMHNSLKRMRDEMPKPR